MAAEEIRSPAIAKLELPNPQAIMHTSQMNWHKQIIVIRTRLKLEPAEIQWSAIHPLPRQNTVESP
jgi:hypothetical protein